MRESKKLPVVVSGALADVCCNARVMAGACAPWEIGPRQEYVRVIEASVAEALSMLSRDVLAVLSLRVRAAGEVLREDLTDAKADWRGGAERWR